ncbi:MAG: hypothetical protein ACLGIA_11340, partial [Actinomycetes bacterium]
TAPGGGKTDSGGQSGGQAGGAGEAGAGDVRRDGTERHGGNNGEAAAVPGAAVVRGLGATTVRVDGAAAAYPLGLPDEMKDTW